jgi:5-methylcytosine-specific restriction enzyme subunit McrC
LFATHLRDEWRRGPVRRYVSRDEDRSPTLRGKWRVSDQLRRPAEKHVFAITSDEFSADNPLNRVFRFVVERLWHLTRDHDNRRTLGDLRQTMEADDIVLPAHVSARDAAPALVSRLHQRFAPLLDLARLFLDGGGLQLLSGGARDTFAFVFDMNKLFEQFVFGFLSRHRAEILPADLRDCDLLPQSRGATRHLAQRDNGLPVFRLEPDIAFRKPDGTFPLLLDTKYKRLDPFDRAHGVSQADFYQMFAYAHRYDCPRVLLVYPQTETSGSLSERFMTGNPPRKIAAVTVDLHLDLGSPAGKRSLTNELRDCLTWKESE